MKLLRIVSWNIHQLDEPWKVLTDDASLDLALLQEAKPPPIDVKNDIVPGRGDAWTMPGYKRAFRTAVVRLSDRIGMTPRRTGNLPSASPEVMGVTSEGTLTVVDIKWQGEIFTCISAYVPWQNVVTDAAKPWIISDASAHRLVSDISTLIDAQRGHRLIVAGDWNILRGYGEDGSAYWARRYATVFDRMEALGLRCVGPSAPNGRQAEPWPAELPKDSRNVPTFHSNRQAAATAARQLDYVFASEGIADRIRVRALNEVAEWKWSDHCRILIEVEGSGST